MTPTAAIAQAAPVKHPGIRYVCPRCGWMYAYRCRCECGAMVEKIEAKKR